MPRPRPLNRPRTLRALTAAAAAVATAGAVATTASISASAQTGDPFGQVPASPCFGAPAHDPAGRCVDAKLRLSVVPSTEDALLEPNARCTPTGRMKVLFPCAFGVPKEDAKAVVALVGDSHAAHWRAAVDGVAQKRGWRGISITRSSCPFSTATPRLEKTQRRRCLSWNRQVPAWFRAHPEVHTVFVSDHRGGRVVVPRGRSNQAAQIKGYLAAWRGLPATVKRIFVIRDTPRSSTGTPDCIDRAVLKSRSPGSACALKTTKVLKPDPAAIAARQVRASRVRLVNLSRYMCTRRFCLPVIGGALVQKDIDHLTQTFSATLAPYLADTVATYGTPGTPSLPGS